eukprot:TRINITY_DN83524_c0_g1_i1.p1 TRINITY_DN83524_c0_g1~~TRINITY_DN83524_c0_g1_i1.p1  ORF type:complete len:162 (-),score=32.77 TRINITY_DN83524_c0_g1_i1:123-608(-)
MSLTQYAELLHSCLMDCLEGDAAGAHDRVDEANKKLKPVAEKIYADFAGESDELSDEQLSVFFSAFADACLVIDAKLMGEAEAGKGAKAAFEKYKEQKSSKDNQLRSIIAEDDKVGMAEIIRALVLRKREPVPPPTHESMLAQMGIGIAILWEHMAITSEG